MNRACLRVLPLAVAGWGLLGPGGCYRAEIDITEPTADSAANGAGASSDAGPSDAGAAGARCDPTPLSDAENACHSFLPDKKECSVQDPDGWNGCYDGGCSVCADVTQKFPFYVWWHPCCQLNTRCTSDLRVKCNARCPSPVDHDAVMPCWTAMSDH